MVRRIIHSLGGSVFLGYALMAFTLVLPCTLCAAEVKNKIFDFRGVENAITVYGFSDYTWVNDDSTSMDAELVLVFSNADVNVIKTIKSTQPFRARVLAVGGGGAGGTVMSSGYLNHPGGGGGGAGELVDRKDVDFAGSTLYTLTIGEGGKAQGSPSEAKPGGDGGESAITFGTDDLIRVKGGGGGGAGNNSDVGKDGGSGGGGSGDGAVGGGAVKNEEDGKVKKGGTSGKRYAAGGGGAGSEGGDGSTGTSGGTGGKGGDGVESDIIWNDVRYYAGGGGGGNTASGAGGAGGAGGGGAGSATASSAAAAVAPTPGTDGLGGGGGGAGRYAVGANGGFGIIVIRITWIKQAMQWADPFPITVGGRTGMIQLDKNATTNWVDGDLVITYTNTIIGGGLKFSTAGTGDKQKIWANARVLVVGGGGGGGFVNDRSGGGGAGGGAGGFAETNGVIICADTEYEILVGAGGAAGTNEAGQESGDGGGSSFKGKDAKIVCEVKGGGGGGAKSAGKNGASGGGGSQVSRDVFSAGGKGTEGQGFAGGAGGTSEVSGLAVGAGGGGASGEGEDADTSANRGGNGGAGKESDISGATVGYAGGGGGAGLNLVSGMGYVGGSATHGGGRGADETTKAQDGVDGTGGGGGGGTGLADDITPAGKGGSGIVIVRLSGFIVGGLPELTPQPTKFTFNNEAQSPIKPADSNFWAYAVSGTTVATNSDNYAYMVAIREGLTCDWLSGGHAVKSYRWEINPLKVELPEILPEYSMATNAPAKFNNTEQTAVRTWNSTYWKTNGVDVAHHYWMGLEVGDHTNTFWYCTLSDYQQTNAGETNLTAILRTTGPNNEANTTNFLWKTGRWEGTMADAKVDWQIGQADNKFTRFTIGDIQFNVGKTISPVVKWTWQDVSSTYPAPRDQVVYTYFKGDERPTSDDDYELTEVPTEPGVYWAHAYICKDSKHEPGNWVEAHDYTRFAIWRHPSEMLTDYVNIKVDNDNAKELKEYPVLLRISEDLIKGFSYDRAGRDGKALRFIQINAESSEYLKPDVGEEKRNTLKNDELLPYEIVKWDPDGESLVWVKINPEAITTTTRKGAFRMYWHENGTEELIDDLLPAQVWSAYAGVWHMDEFNTFDATAKSQATSPNATTIEGIGARIDAHIANTPGTLTEQEGILGTKGVQTAKDANGAGIWMKDPGENSPLDGGSQFVISGWFKHYGADYSWDHIFYKRSRAVNDNGKEYANPYYDAFAIEVNDASFKIDARGSSKTTTTQTPTVDPNGKWVQLAFVYDGTSCSIYENGALVKTFSITSCKDNDAPLAVGNNSNYEVDGIIDSPWRGLVDEVRFVKGTKDGKWVKAEYEMMTKTNCTFGLVNKPVADADPTTREWIDYWVTEPELKYYWKPGELKQTDITNKKGELRSNALFASDTSKSVMYFGRTMPSEEAWGNEGQEIPTANGVYTVEYLHARDKDQYGQLWAYLDGTRLKDFEIVGSDPTTNLNGTVTGRILLANDDTNAMAQVTGQSYSATNPEALAWWEHSTQLPQELKCFNLWPGVDHTFWISNATTQVKEPLWKLSGIYFGNLLNTNSWSSAVISNAFNTLPRSPTSLNSFANYEEPFDWHQAGHLVMQNSETAMIESGWYTNGIGTIYFDVVNAYASDELTNMLQLVVEVSEDPANLDRSWSKPLALRIMKYSGSETTVIATNDTAKVNCLNMTSHSSAGSYFYRVFAEVNRTTPCRFRIRRWGEVVRGEGEEGANKDDPKGFIVLDNLIASFAPPVPTFSTYGKYDSSRTGKAILGTETAFTINYPSVGDTNIYGRARLIAGDTNAVSSARLRYRWRYLNGAIEPKQAQGRETWKMVMLEQVGGSDEFRTTAPLAHRALLGDIEYYFDVTATVPFYQYVDYTGSTTRKLYEDMAKKQEYSEDPRGDEPERYRSEEQHYPSYGRDWFVRLRDFPSPTRGYKILSRTSLESAAIITNEMDFIDRGIWRGFVKTFDNTNKTEEVATELYFRFEREVPENPGAIDLKFLKTDYWAKEGVETLPNTLSLVTSTDDNEWTKIPRDGKTGYIMFQLSEDEFGTPGQLSIVHADYQDFNSWDDAQKDGDYFVGNSTENETKTGVSVEKREYEEDFSRWTDTSATNGAWREAFTASAGDFGKAYTMYKTFDSASTPNGWSAGNGMWVHEKYKVDGQSAAFQMEGCGKGYLEVQELTPALRGLESITLSTRLAQFLEWDDIAYDATVGSKQTAAMTNYTFVTQFAMSPNDWAKDTNEQFDGAGSVSVFAFFRDGIGAYEFRVTRSAKSGIRSQLFKWTKIKGQMVATPLGEAQPRNSQDKTKEADESFQDDDTDSKAPWFNMRSSKYSLLYISCSRQANGSVRIQGGVAKARTTPGSMTASGNEFVTISYLDTNSPLNFGVGGLASANCPAVFVEPRYADGAATWFGDDTKPNQVIYNNAKNNTAFGAITPCAEDLEWWMLGRFEMDSEISGLTATAIPQELKIQWKPSASSKADWTNLVTHTVSGFTMAEPKPYTFNRVEDGIYRFSHGGTTDEGRGDIVIDNVELKQWRGTDTGNYDAMSWISEGDRNYAWRSNFVFTSGWIETWNGKPRVTLSAKRTKSGHPASIRSPLLNGNVATDCGIGLGMISIGYENAQENVNLLVQVITNNVTDATAVNNWQEEVGQWETITNFDFSAMTPLERRNGVLDVYLGLHGIKGIMRIVMDPTVVAAVKDETEADKFGEITISKIYCRDEPAIDQSSWWGWNLRTLSFADEKSRWDNGLRTYLPDYAVIAEHAGKSGMSLALNNSITQDVRPGEDETYKQHIPFVQTPTLNAQVGEVTFRARVFSLDENPTPALVTIFGSETGDPNQSDNEWKKLETIEVTNSVYETYHFRAPSSAYRAFRLGVTGVKGVEGETPSNPVRVLLDEIAVSEALYPKLGFKYVYPVRTGLTDNSISYCFADGEPIAEEQPLVGENWTVQAEVEVKQLPDELELDNPDHAPRVLFYYHKSRLPWGFTKWGATAEPIELKPATGPEGDEKLIFRGSFTKAPNAIMDAAEKDGEVVQFMAKVVYWDKSGSVHTNEIEQGTSGGWTTPKWYHPVDYNAGAKSFSPFVLFETVAPNRVWINEVNLFDGRATDYSWPSDNNQYIEIAVPVDQSLEGWRLEYVDNGYVTGSMGDFMATTNTLLTFGKTAGRIPCSKTENETNDYVFIVVQSPATEKAGTWKNVTRPDGTKVEIDGTWSTTVGEAGTLNSKGPIALRLIRPSLIVEQQITLEGTNTWLKSYTRSMDYYLQQLNGEKKAEKPNYYPVGNEYGNAPVVGLQGRSLGVYQNTGAVSNDWNKVMHQTPGWCNEGQIVPEGWVILPNGEMVVVTAKIEGGHLVHKVGDRTNTTERIQFTIPKGGEGTNVIYTIDNYYEIASVTTNGQPVAEAAHQTGAYELRVAQGVSNNVTVIARAQPWEDLETRYGLAKDSRYRAAILDWLEKGRTLRGEFKNPGEISLGEFRDLAGNFVTNLSIVETYWLDMDPSEAGWWLQGGVTEAPDPKYRATNKKKLLMARSIDSEDQPGADGEATYDVVSNFTIRVKLQMTNTATHVSYAPYVLRRAKVGSTSVDYGEGDTTDWDSASFKVTGDLQNGNPYRTPWIPLRWFRFMPDFSKPNLSASFDENNEALIEIWDPFDPRHSSVAREWSKYKDSPVFYRWSIDERNMPVAIEPLMPDSTFPEDWKE